MRTLSGVLALLAVAVLPVLPAQASGEAAKPADPWGRATPRGTVVGFLRLAHAGRFEQASRYLQLSEHERQREGAEIARRLAAVMDFALVADLDRINDTPQGSLDDGLPPQREFAGKLQTEKFSERLYVTRVEDAEFGPLWLIASDTLALAPGFYADIGFPEIERQLPAALTRIRFLSIELWRWIAVAVGVPLSFAAAWLLLQLLRLPLRIKHWIRDGHTRENWWSVTSTPALVMLAMLFHRITVSLLRIPILYRQYYTRVVWISLTIAAAWLAWRWIRLGIDKAHRSAVARGAVSTVSLLLLSRRILKAAMLALVAFVCLSILGFQLTPALAGLGFGGLALAFAAQKTLENVFGGVSLLSDQTIRVGDFCSVGGQKGTVEDIGLRSTSLRTLDRTLLSIPNGALAAMTIENFAYRDKIFFNPTVNLRYETTAGQMRAVLDGIRRMIEEDPRLQTDGSRARFTRIGPSSLDVEIFAYVLTRDVLEFNAIREELLLRLMDIVEKAGTGFAFQSQTLYVARDRPPRADGTREPEGEPESR